MPEEPPVVVVEINRKRLTVGGETAKVIMYLAENASFFNDRRTFGNFVLLAKQGNLSLKSDAILSVD